MTSAILRKCSTQPKHTHSKLIVCRWLGHNKLSTTQTIACTTAYHRARTHTHTLTHRHDPKGQGPYLGTRATSTSFELFTFASAGMGAAALDTSGQTPKLVAVSTVEPFGVS